MPQKPAVEKINNLRPRLTRKERKVIWICAALALVALAALFTLAMVGKFQIDERFLLGFYWIANVIAATAAGILTSIVSGFLVVSFKKDIGKNARLVIEGTGGFAVFLLVMWSNPQNQMSKLADTVFLSLLSECEQAAHVGNEGRNSNARESCRRLIASYPRRPEPYSYLARSIHIYDRDSAGTSAQLYEKAISLYGLPLSSLDAQTVKHIVLTPIQSIHLMQDLSSYGFAKGDYLLTAYSRHEISRRDVLGGFDGIIYSSRLLSDGLLTMDSDSKIWARTFDIRGKLALYGYFLDSAKNVKYLREAVMAYEAAIQREKDYPLMLQYHKFVGLVLLESNNLKGDESAVSVLQKILDGWSAHFRAQWVYPERGVYKEFFSRIVRNDRQEPWVVTEPFGSVEMAGSEIKAFLNREPTALAKLKVNIQNL